MNHHDFTYQWFEAIRNSDERTVGKLLDKGFDPYTPNPGTEYTALYLTIRYRDPSMAQLLIQHYTFETERVIDGEDTPLYLASKFNNPGICEMLLNRGADVNGRSGPDGATPLFNACRGKSRKEVFDLLIQRGADVNIATTDVRTTPLMVATANRLVYQRDVLLARGADPDAVSFLCQRCHLAY